MFPIPLLLHPPKFFSLGIDDIVQVLKHMSGWYQAMNSILSIARSDPSEKKVLLLPSGDTVLFFFLWKTA